jgi:tetratricopeptide (TPR) repeat protein
LDRPEKALNEFMVAMSLKPEHDIIKINLSVFYERQKEYEKAIEILKDLISRNPNDGTLYYRLGRIYKMIGDYGVAISAFTKSMELAPDIINPYEELGNIYLHQFNDVEKAKFYYTRGIEAVPQATSKVDMLRRIVQDLESR